MSGAGNVQVEGVAHEILARIAGETPEREGLLRTPNCVAMMYAELPARSGVPLYCSTFAIRERGHAFAD